MTREAMQAEIAKLTAAVNVKDQLVRVAEEAAAVHKREYEKIAKEYRALSDLHNAQAAGLGPSKRGADAQENHDLTVQGQFARRLTTAIMRLVAATPEDSQPEER